MHTCTMSAARLASMVFLAGFALPASAASYRQLYAFQGNADGSYPLGGVISVGNALFGTTSGIGPTIVGNGTVFALGYTLRTLYTFQGGADGANPVGDPVSVDGTLYGVTINDGPNNGGTVYAVDRKNKAERVVHAFGTGTDGAVPQSGLIKYRGMLYGTTTYGGKNGLGTVYSINPSTGSEQVIYSFQPQNDAARPQGGLYAFNGLLYGTTVGGGTSNAGAVFSLNPRTGAEAVLHFFSGSDGSSPTTTLTSSGGLLYGTTVFGGPNSAGVIFSLDPSSGAEQVVFAFDNGMDGGDPLTSLVNVSGILYGTTVAGGSAQFGTVYTFDPVSGKQTTTYSFAGGADGAFPEGNLKVINGVLYGTTNSGGSSSCGGSGCGTIFAIAP